MEKQTSYGPFSKDWSELTFSDNYIFTQVLQNETLYKEVLKIISGLSITKIEYIPSDEKSSSSDKVSDNTTVTTEKMIDPNYLSKGIRLDALVEDSDKLYDIEIQTGNYSDLFLKLRYDQSQIDNYYQKGYSYRALKESYIFFICKDDPFGADFPKYTRFTDFEEYYDTSNVEGNNHKGKYQDNSHVIIYNASAYGKVDNNIPLRDFLEYVSKGTYSGNTEFLDKLDSAVKKTKQDSTSKGKYMVFQDAVKKAVKEAVSDNTAMLEEKYKKELEASEEKRKQDLEKQKMESAKKLLQSGVSLEIVLASFTFSEEEIEVLKKENN